MHNTHYYIGREKLAQFMAAQNDQEKIDVYIIGNRPFSAVDYEDGDKMKASGLIQEFRAKEGTTHSNAIESIFDNDHFSVNDHTWTITSESRNGASERRIYMA